MEEMGVETRELGEFDRTMEIVETSGTEDDRSLELQTLRNGDHQEEGINLLLPKMPARRKKHGTSKVTAKHLLQVLERQNYRCAMSGVPLDPENAAVDHIIPVSRGGEHSIENVQVLHESVNAAKRNMLPEEFIEMCVNVARHHGKL